MKLRSQLSLFAVAMALIPAVLTGAIVFKVATRDTQAALETATVARLRALATTREIGRAHV